MSDLAARLREIGQEEAAVVLEHLVAENECLQCQLVKQSTAFKQIVAAISPHCEGTLGDIRQCAVEALFDEQGNSK